MGLVWIHDYLSPSHIVNKLDFGQTQAEIYNRRRTHVLKDPLVNQH